MNRLSFFLIVANMVALTLILFWTLDPSQQDEILRVIKAVIFGEALPSTLPTLP